MTIAQLLPLVLRVRPAAAMFLTAETTAVNWVSKNVFYFFIIYISFLFQSQGHIFLYPTDRFKKQS